MHPSCLQDKHFLANQLSKLASACAAAPRLACSLVHSGLLAVAPICVLRLTLNGQSEAMDQVGDLSLQQGAVYLPASAMRCYACWVERRTRLPGVLSHRLDLNSALNCRPLS